MIGREPVSPLAPSATHFGYGVVSGGVLLTVTVTPAEIVRFPAASLATAVSVCEPFDVVVVSHPIEYGLAVSSDPRLAPSSLNCTPAIPAVLEAEAETVTGDPETVEPVAGAVIETLGDEVPLSIGIG